MYTLLLTPLIDEFTPLLEAFNAMGYYSTPKTIGNLTIHEIKELKLFLAQGGHGKTQFGVQTQHLLDLISNISLVICAGAAGGIAHFINIGDIVVATSTVEHDYNLKFAKRPLPDFAGSSIHIEKIQSINSTLSNGFKIHFGKIASGDEDVIERPRAEELHNLTSALAVAWEGAGGARATQFMKIPYLEIRGLTDVADNEAPIIFDENLKVIMPRIASLVASLQLTSLQQTAT
ncbi:MAG: 5'-methylthioadenosine/S-adenosylhomocysteine nucleosidase [Anaerolineales bacterium]|jgi:adenosylhomocysteine nucleosidase|nr:5'-methylthioadenosine/S-adenosylhomocysteine nucleosidase [Anaerolineales bacterium]